MSSETGSTLFKRVGEEPFFVSLVDRFYDLVESDPVLRPTYPADLEPGISWRSPAAGEARLLAYVGRMSI